MIQAVLFDVDGTLVDTNDAHAQVWHETFEAFGHDVAFERIRPEIGKGGDKLVPALVGDEVERREGEAMRRMHGERWVERARRERFRVFPGVRELLTALRERGLRTAIATSSRRDHLKETMRAAGLDLESLVDEIVTASDADESKPAPDVLEAAMEKVGVGPSACAMIGDTPHDALAACRAGVTFVGVTCGGHEERRLRDAGARRVWPDPAAIVRDLPALLG